MPTLLLAGIPARMVTRAKAALAPIEDDGVWDVRFFPGSAKLTQISAAEVNGLMAQAEKLGGAHIVGFQETGDRSRIAREIKQHFRFRWGDEKAVWASANVGGTLLGHILRILEEESLWREHVMPKDKGSPLILPGKLFSRLHGHEDIWEQSEIFGRGLAHYRQLAKKIEQFQRAHLKMYAANRPMFMIDRAHLVWKDSGPYHAATPFPKRWKYSFQLVDAFHYDVEHHKGDKFTLTDAGNATFTIKAGKHANIDCHGFRSH